MMGKLQRAFPTYKQPGVVTFGTGAVKALLENGDLTETAIFLSGQEEVRTIVASSLQKYGYDLAQAHVMTKPAGEPTYTMVQTGAAFLRRTPFRRIVGIGGGSVLDWCRLAWAASQDMLSLDDGKVGIQDAIERRPEFWLVPTTCGTGAEAANVAVFSVNGRKLPVVSPAFIADRVILDGQFLRGVSPESLACSLCDALSHAIEAFVSIIPCSLAKEAALSALCLILDHYANDSDSRAQHLMEAGYFGGVAAANCSVGAIHAFAHTMATYGVPHGYANALGLIAGIIANQETPAMHLLLRRCGLGTIETLVHTLRPVVQRALSSHLDVAIDTLLHDQTTRAVISERMATDVCMRSNPKMLDAEARCAFLDCVLETVESVCTPHI
jgi:alcohol dehydrogenase class IV